MSVFPDLFKRKKNEEGREREKISQFLFLRIIASAFLEETFETGRNNRCGKTFGRKKRGTNVLPQWTLLPKRP